jgi:hypothetical protein
MNPVCAQGEPLQLQLEGFDQLKSHVRALATRVADSGIATRRSTKKPDARAEDLNFPLFDATSFIFDATLEVIPKSQLTTQVSEPAVAQAAPAEVDDPKFADVTLEVFTKLHAGLLWRQMELLLWSKEADGAARMEILDWVFAPMEHTHSVTGKTKSILLTNVPFSFELCCYVEEVDPDALKAAIVDRVLAIKQGTGQRIRASLH